MRSQAPWSALCAAAVLVVPSSAVPSQGPGFTLLSGGHGQGQVLPHRIPELDGAGMPTGDLIEVRSLGDLITHGRSGNGLLPSPVLDTSPVLPGGIAGNHFLRVTLSDDVDPESVFDFEPSGLPNNSLSGLVEVTATVGGQTAMIPGRVFLGGATPGRVAAGGVLPFLSLVRRAPGGGLLATAMDEDGDGAPDGLGFPGTEGGFIGDEDLVDRRTLVFVPDSDGDLRSHETLPAGATIQMRLRPGLRARSGAMLVTEVLLSTTVGADSIAPAPRVEPGNPASLLILPADGSAGVDPATDVEVFFSEPIQIGQLGPLPGQLALPGAIDLEYGESLAIAMPVNARPASVFAFDHWILTPPIAFPGQGSSSPNCGDLGAVTLFLGPNEVSDLGANTNIGMFAAGFSVGLSPGIVNAPVAPEAILVGRRSPAAISVLDLNGFGASTGSPRFDPSGQNPRPGDSHFPNDPNIIFGAVDLMPGTCTVDGGSAGVFTLTLDSNLDAALVRTPTVVDVSDMAIGRALDQVFNNAVAPFGCQAAGGDACAADGLKIIEYSFGGGSLALDPGSENLLSWAPHPNPPPLTFPPLCVAPQIFGSEPTSTDNPGPNLLTVGDPFGDPTANPPIPPSGKLTGLMQPFEGPSDGQAGSGVCSTYMIRQQIGHFEYVLDRQREELVVFNSNRQTVIERIALPGAASLALSPVLDFLAVTQRGLDQVSFVDVSPASATFHQVVHVTSVGAGPLGVAWQSENEDILVCNEFEDSLSIISALDFQERKRVSGFLGGGPFEVVALPRMDNYGFRRNVYFAWILQRDGTLAMFESGPDGPGGWGFDDVIGLAPNVYQGPKALSAASNSIYQCGVWVAHEGPIDVATGQAGPAGVGAISLVHIESAVSGQLPLPGTSPQFRSMQLAVLASIGEPQISGIPVDLAEDNMLNLTALPSKQTPFRHGAGIPANGRGLIRAAAGGSSVNSNNPNFLLAAIPHATQPALGVVDVISGLAAGFPLVDTNPFQPGQQSVRVPGVRILVDGFRQ